MAPAVEALQAVSAVNKGRLQLWELAVKWSSKYYPLHSKHILVSDKITVMGGSS